MLIQYYNIWRSPKITKAFLTAMKNCIFDPIHFKKKETMQKNIFPLFYGLDNDDRLASSNML